MQPWCPLHQEYRPQRWCVPASWPQDPAQHQGWGQQPSQVAYAVYSSFRDLCFQSANAGHFLSKPTGESPQNDSSDAIDVSWMWKTHFLACMWAVGPLCGLTASPPIHKGLLSVYMHINVCVCMCVVSVYRVYECPCHPQSHLVPALFLTLWESLSQFKL